MKKILINTYPGAYIHHGGGEREIHLLKEVLNTEGVLTDIYGPTSLPLSNYDTLIQFSMIGGSESVIEAAVEAKLKRILWPNLWQTHEPSDEQLAHIKHFATKFDTIVFKSKAEEQHFAKYVDIADKKIIHIYPLVSPKFFRQNISDVFRETHGFKPYAIWTGIIEPQKNQLSAVKAFAGLDLNLFISGEIRDRHYFELCKKSASNNVKFISSMPFGSEIHLSALAHCDIYLELPLDFPGTSALEAMAIGCRLLLNQCDWCEEMIGENCMQVNPLDENSICSGVTNALLKYKTTTNSKLENLKTNISVTPLVSYLLN